MAFKATKAQENAINSKGCVLVSAAAGSGKTAVLVERVIKMLTDCENPVLANRMLIVTFTNAAATQMRSRIESRLYSELEKNSSDELISRQCHLIKSADICTIDSFCIRLVRENFALCSVEPDFKVTDDSSLYSIRQEILNSIISEHIINKSEGFSQLLELSNCRFGEEKLLSLIDDIYIAAKKTPDINGYINSISLPYNTSFDREHIWYRYAFLYAKEKTDSMKDNAARLAEAALFCENTDKAVLYSESVSNIIYDIEFAVSSGDWNTVFEAVRSGKIDKLPAKSTDEMKSLKEQIVKSIDDIKSFFCLPLEDISKDLSALRVPVNLLCNIVRSYNDRLFERLKEENKFSFDDIEQLALGLLCRADEKGNILKTEHADSIVSRYDAVLVDEFQDVNDLQDTLFEILSADGKNLFIVGDVKQCIYAFRGSNPDIFLNKKNTYEDYSEHKTDKRQKIFLSDNFRSREGVCSSVNFFFENLMSRQVGGLVYDDDEKLSVGADFPENGEADTELLVIDKVDDESTDSTLQSEAVAIANYIEETVKKGKILRDTDGKLRQVQYGDFCVLLAALKEKAGIIADELGKRFIPASVADGDFLKSTEIVTALALLHIIDNPQSDVDLLRVLMSPVYGFTAEEMAKIRIGRKDIGLFSALSAYAPESEKARAFLNQISEFRRMSCMLPLDSFISYVVDNTDMMNIFYSLPSGQARSQNLMLLMKLASDYSAGSSGSIYGFLKHINSMPEGALRASGESNGQSVKIMSIHHSKGLQFPVCIVAGLSNKINKSDSTASCIYSKDYGIGFKYFDKLIFDKKENLGHKVLNAETEKTIACERLRLLYVAMTRAEEKLCLVCSLKNARSSLIRAAGASNFGKSTISGDFIINASNSADYILASAILHPSAEVLRRVCECGVKTVSHKSNIAVSFIDAAKLSSAGSKERKVPLADGELKKAIEKNIAYKYPFASLSGVPAKISVSMLANKAENEHFAMTDRPSFMENGGLSASDRGTLTHKIMQFIEFKKSPDIEGEIDRLIKEKRISESQAAAVDKGSIKRFLESELYSRICAAHTVRREMRFLTELPVSFYHKEQSDFQDKFIIQGAVDLCFLEEDGVVVVDFKTDTAKDNFELKEKYGEQLSIYAVACEKIFGMPVKEKIIYSFSLSRQINI